MSAWEEEGYRCPSCGCDEFYAHQNVELCVKVNVLPYIGSVESDAMCDVLETMEGSEYALDDPEGPFECVECGASWNSTEDLVREDD